MPQSTRLKHSLTGYPPHLINEKTTIPEGAEITISDYHHNETDSLVSWAGVDLVVDKELLATFEDHS
jgi:hypothetical protein